MKNALFLLLLLFVTGICSEAYAGDASPIFDSLASKASTIGMGLRNTGFIIAGFGLIVFSFMAIFNKISWKMLAYIMMSTFILSTMIAIISYFANNTDSADPHLNFSDVQSTGPGGNSMDVTKAQVGKEGGDPEYGNGTAPYTLDEANPANSVQNQANQEVEKTVEVPTSSENEEEKQKQAEAEKLEDAVKDKLPIMKIGNSYVAGPRTPENLMPLLKLKDAEAAVADAQKKLEQWENLSEAEKNTEYAQKMRDIYTRTIEAGRAKIEAGQEIPEQMIRVKMQDGTYKMVPMSEVNASLPKD